MNTITRRPGRNAERRRFGGRSLVAIVAAAALTLGPGAMSAFADDTAPPVDATAPVATEPAEVVAPVEPAPEPAAEPAPEPAAPAEVPPAEPPAPVTETPSESADPSTPAEDAADAADPSEAAPADDEAEPLEAAALESEPAEDEPTEDEADPLDEAARNGNSNPGKKIDVCHATGAEGHWVMVPANANGAVSGHAGWDHQDGRDIIPPFDYTNKGKPAHFAGQNWDAEGQAIYRNNCEKPPPPPQNPVVEVTVDGCVVPWKEIPAQVTVYVSGLMKKFDYTLEVTGPGYDFLAPLEPSGDGTAQVDLSIYGAGDYVATVTGMKSAPGDKKEGPKPPVTVTGSQVFSVSECPKPPKPPKPENPVVEVSVDQCVPPNGVVPSSVAITVTELNHRFNYWMEVTGPDGFFEEMEVTPGEDGSFFVELPVPGPGDYVATVTGTRGHGGDHEWPEWPGDIEIEEPASGVAAVQFSSDFEGPRHGGKITLTGSAEFTVNPDCAVTPGSVTPVLPITSSPAPIQALATTGATGNDSSLAAALLVLLGAGSALAAAGARRSMKSRG